ncbi:MAG: hypothetical protein Q9209_003954 [Squamulea sp. 1 TL-2023]
MRVLLLLLLLSIKAIAAPPRSGERLESRDDQSDFGILTSYFGYAGCSDDQKKQLVQAQKDAVMLAQNAVKSPGINFKNDPAAIDFFGPADETNQRGTRQHIIDQLTGVSNSFPGSGVSDWWNNRYVDLWCHDDKDSACDGAAAYTRLKSNKDKFPTIVFCPGFFDKQARPSLADAKATIDKNSVLKGWVSALQSQAIDKVGPKGLKKETSAYKPGRGKLLAMTKDQGPERASQNTKPRAWNPELSIDDNKKNDELPPGPYRILADDLENPDTSPEADDGTETLEIAADNLFPDSAYPQDYISIYGSPSQHTESSPSSSPLPVEGAKDENVCHGVGGDFWVIHRDTAVHNAEDFCKQSSKSLEYNQDSVDHLRLSVDFPEDSNKGPGDTPNCRDNFVNAIIDGCDGNNPVNNPHNYKFGSTFTLANGWVLKMEPLSKQINDLSCDVSYKFVFNGFEIRGKNWPDGKLGANGEGLEAELKGCGALTKWKFERTPDDVKFQWFASGQLPVGTKNCIGDAARTAGAAGEGNCHGPGK